MYKMLMICKNMQNIQSKPIIKKFRRFRQCTVYSFICAYPVNLIDKNNCRRKIIDKGNQLTRIYFSESPLHLHTNELAVMLKKV